MSGDVHGAAQGDVRGNVDAVVRAPDAVGGPVFAEAWQADAFAVVQALVDAEVITPHEWSSALGAAITRAQAAGDPDLGDTYYDHWASALEALVVAKGLLSAGVIDEREAAWEAAYERTPHGHPVELHP